MKMLPSQPGSGFLQIEHDLQWQVRVLVSAQAIVTGLNFVAPGFQCRGVMIDLGDRGSNCRHRVQKLGRKREVENENGFASNIGQ